MQEIAARSKAETADHRTSTVPRGATARKSVMVAPDACMRSAAAATVTGRIWIIVDWDARKRNVCDRDCGS